MMRRTILGVASALLLGFGLATVPGAAPAAKSKAKTVGSVTALGGTKNLTIGGKRLAKGATLTLGQHLVMGKGVTATLRLKKPKGVGDRDLVDLRPAKGLKFTIKVSRVRGTITVKVAPV